MREFWCVMREGGAIEAHSLASLAVARERAERLACENPGVTFVVLHAVGVAYLPAVAAAEWHDMEPALDPDDLPF